jgi:DNA repair protein SbcD/Mre11
MRIVHLADIHLGYRQYYRQTPNGLNQREADIGNAFRDAIQKVIELEPDIVLIAGDVFHSVRPTNPAILHAYNQFSRLVQELPNAIVVMVAGNHDKPRTSETGCILELFRNLGIVVVHGRENHVRFPDRGVSILAIPDGIRPRPAFEPDPLARYNVLMMHDEIEGVIKHFGPLVERAASPIPINQLRPDRWDYVALGHYHVYHQVAENAYYSGATEYASTNVWGEVDEEHHKGIPGKGIIEHDLATGEHRFHPLSLARRVVDLPRLSASGLTPQQLGEAICAAVDQCEGGIDDRIVRLVVTEVPRHVLRDIDQRPIREFKRRALHFLLDARRPAPIRIEGSGAPGRRTSLTDTVRTMLHDWPLTPGIERKSLVDLGLHYLSETERLSSPVLVDSQG